MQETNQSRRRPFPKVLIHPISLVNIAYNLTKDCFCHSELGIILGDHKDDSISIQISFKIFYSDSQEGKEIDFTQTKQKISIILKVFPDYKILGLYSTNTPNQDEINLLHKLEINIDDDSLLLIWNNDQISDRSGFEPSLIDIYHISSLSERDFQLTQVSYLIEGNLINIPDDTSTLKRRSQEAIENTYTAAIKKISLKLWSKLKETAQNSVFPADQEYFSELNQHNAKTSHMPLHCILEFINEKIDESALSTNVGLTKTKVLRILKFLEIIKTATVHLDSADYSFKEIDLKTINKFLSITPDTEFEKETGQSKILILDKSTNIENSLNIIKCITYYYRKQKKILSFQYLYKWFESRWAFLSNLILEIICKNKLSTSEYEMDYLVSQIHECEIVSIRDGDFQKWDRLPIEKFEEFCMLWVLALRNKEHYPELINKYSYIILPFSKKLEQLSPIKDKEIGSFALYWLSLIKDKNESANIDYENFINKNIGKIKSRCTFDLIMKLIVVKHDIRFNEQEFVENLADLFQISKKCLILKAFSVKTTFMSALISYYMTPNNSISEEIYLMRVKFALELINTYICDLKKFDNLLILENFGQNINVGNILSNEILQSIIEKLVNTQLETGIYNDSFLKWYFDTLTSEHQVPEAWDWIDNIKNLLIYVLLSKTVEETQRRRNIMSRYIVRFASNRASFMTTAEEIKTIQAILDFSYRFIPNIHDELARIFSKIHDEEKNKFYNSSSLTLEYQDKMINFIYINKIYWHSYQWRNTENDIIIPALITDILNTIVLYLEEATISKIISELKQKLEDLSMRELWNFDLKSINYEDCKTSNAIGKYLASILVKWGVPNMIIRLNLNENSDKTSSFYWNIQTYIFKEIQSNFAFKLIFDENTHFAIRQLLLSRFSEIFFCDLEVDDLMSILDKLNNYAATIIIESQPEKIPPNIEKKLHNLLNSNAAKTAFEALGFSPELLKSLNFEIFIFKIPNELDGITLFGGTILLSPWLFKEDRLSKCFQKIKFIHEIENLLRRRTNNNCYNAEPSTPKIDGSIGIEKTGYKPSSSQIPVSEEDGHQIEKVLFGSFISEVNERQMDYINDIGYWMDPYITFKNELSQEGNSSLIKYSHGRNNDGVYKVHRTLHKKVHGLITF